MDPVVERAIAHTPEDGRAWLRAALPQPERPFDRAAFARAFASARRKLGARIVSVHPEPSGDGDIGTAAPWTVDELARVALIRAALDALDALDAEGAVELLRDLYARGDSAERRAVLRSLPVLPDPERFVGIAVEACRSHEQTVFEAIACENPYPARYFPDEAFNQMAIKALFTEVELARIRDLDGRVRPELVRMAHDYATERRAAGRSVPSDIERITGLVQEHR